MVRKTKKSAVKSTEIVKPAEATAVIAPAQISYDTMTAVLIVSLAINMFVLIGWVAIQTTSAYDAQVAAFLFTR